MIVICICDIDIRNAIKFDDLSVGKKYKVIGTNDPIWDDKYFIESDFGKNYFYPKSNFKTIEEHRNKILNNIL